ncbi:hypothetical protein Tsubulata_047494 [Turnera subulata]|uniref:Uncharacterized protein n=1 Tax=Turnera subulata TaxID=218843 RepID=A0A9Q0F736_9ROSI|nr:hypothetical protein Tsubulata_047494 [Turnera subulata]
MVEVKGYTQDGTVDLRGRPVLASTTGKWKACAFLVGYEAFERMAFYGIASNLVNYLTRELHEDTVSSVRNVNNWSGSVWITPILGAYIADTYLGRYWTFTISSLIYALGMILLTMAVSFKFLKPTCIDGVCNKATSSQITFFYCSLYIIAIGAGGTKPNISTFGADQFDDFNHRERRLKVSFFNWWMFSSFLGALIATLGLVYIQENNGWGLGYGIPTVGLLLSLVIFYLGTPLYRHKARNTGSPTRSLIQVVVAAFRRRKLQLPDNPLGLHELEPQYYTDRRKRQLHHTTVWRCLDRAAMKDGDTGASNHTCTVTQVESVKLVLGMFLIWLVTLVPSIIWAQINTLFVKQGTTMDRSLGPDNFQIPAASLGSFVTLTMLLAVPMYDRCFVPLARKKTGNPRGITLLQRLGIGFVIQIIAIAVAYAVELRRMHVISEHNILSPKETVPMSILWLLPQYVLLGTADVFNAIGLLEFFYYQSPQDMQSLGTTFFTSGIGVGNFLNSFLVTLVDKITGTRGKSWIGNNLNDSHLDYYYGFLLVISTLNLGAFMFASSRFVYKKETLNLNETLVEIESKTMATPSLGLQV